MCSKGGESSIFKIDILKPSWTLRGGSHLGGVLFKSKEKHLKQGEKISKLENASCNPIHIPLTIWKDFPKDFAKTKQVVQMWSKILKERKQSMHILLKYKLV